MVFLLLVVTIGTKVLAGGAVVAVAVAVAAAAALSGRWVWGSIPRL